MGKKLRKLLRVFQIKLKSKMQRQLAESLLSLIQVPATVTNCLSECAMRWLTYGYYFFAGLVLLGALRALWTLLYELFFIREKNLLKRYGEGSWAVITESSHGLGWNLSKKLARRGFKLIMIDKSGDRLSEKISLLEEMLTKASNLPFNYDKNELRFMGIQADFSVGDNPNFYDQIVWKMNEMEIQVKDISLLVLSPNRINLKDQTSSLGKSIGFVKEHIFPATMLTKKLLPGFHERSETGGLKSGIIMISSMAGVMPVAQLGLYSAVQSYLNYFSEGYNWRYEGKFDVLTVTPPIVVKGSEEDGNTVSECGDGIIRAMGNLDRTYGCTKHVVFGFCVDLLVSLGLTCVVQWYLGGMENSTCQDETEAKPDRPNMFSS